MVKEQQGTSSVEFALVLVILLVLVLGMFEFGMVFSMRQVIVNASREGARYGVAYKVDAAGNRVAPADLSPSIQNWILDPAVHGVGLRAIMPANANPNVPAPGGTGYNTGTAGSDLRVTVNCNYQFVVIHRLLPFLGPNIDLAATTVMRVE